MSNPKCPKSDIWHRLSGKDQKVNSLPQMCYNLNTTAMILDWYPVPLVCTNITMYSIYYDTKIFFSPNNKVIFCPQGQITSKKSALGALYLQQILADEVLWKHKAPYKNTHLE